MIKNIKHNTTNEGMFKLIYLSIISSVFIPMALGYLSELTCYRFEKELSVVSGIYIIIGIFLYIACSMTILIKTVKKSK